MITVDHLLLAAVGFVAQLVDGALGMAFGLIATSVMLAMGIPPAHASATVHAAEIATTAASGTSHALARNINWPMLRRLAIAGALGGALGALVLSRIDGNVIRPFIGAYLLLMGILILMRAARMAPLKDANTSFAGPLGLVGGFLDAIGGGGWGPMVTSTLIGSGHAPRTVIGSVALSEFFVTLTITAMFFSQIGLVHLDEIIALAAGGILAAPFAGQIARHVRPRLLMIAVGLLVIVLALREIARLFG